MKRWEKIKMEELSHYFHILFDGVIMAMHLIASPAVLSMWACKNISHIEVYVAYYTCFQPYPIKIGTANSGETAIKQNLGLQICDK